VDELKPKIEVIATSNFCLVFVPKYKSVISNLYIYSGPEIHMLVAAKGKKRDRRGEKEGERKRGGG
jgi:hypothetical protein